MILSKDYQVIASHVRRMLRSADPLSILIRGMSMIDEALKELIEKRSALRYKRLEDSFGQITLLAKANMACALGAISVGELATIAEVNRLRNAVAHRIDIDVVQGDEASVVAVARSQTKLFRGMDYDPKGFPRTLAFLLLTLFQSLTIRTGREGWRLQYEDDETNTEHVGAIALVRTLTDVVTKGIQAESAVEALLKAYIDEARSIDAAEARE